MIELGVNIDHVATLRQARKSYEPDPVWAAVEAELGGADSITVHLREDRRHIQDGDVKLLRQTVQTRLNLEMSLAEPIVDLAIEVKPHQATLVPEKREEVTTEGGLDIIAQAERTHAALARLRKADILVSAFIDPDLKQVEQAVKLGFDAVELHTGSYANASGADVEIQRRKLVQSGALAVRLGLRLHAGHGLNYRNTAPIAAIPRMAELNIGHAIISRALFIGLRQAVTQMKQIMQQAAPPPQPGV